MERSFLQLYLEAFNSIEGWFSYDAALTFMAYSEFVSGFGVAGDVLEIGVHHGLSAIAIASLRGTGKRFYAVDLFEGMQDRNISVSGGGSRRIFEQNMQRFYSDTSFLHVIAGPSTALSAATLGTGFSFCHIDGGHSRKETFHDLELCHSVLLPGGLIAIDDYFNSQYPGVCEGAVQFMLEHPNALRPLAIGYNKVIFQKLPFTFDLNEQFRRAFPEAQHKIVQLWDTPTMLMTLSLRTFVNLLASTPKHLVSGGAVYSARFAPAHSRIEAKPGQTICIPVTVTNTSTSEVLPSGEQVCGLSYHLLSSWGELLRHDNDRTWLETALKPGVSETVRLSVQAPSQNGDYKIEIDLVWEHVMWLKDVGNPTELVDLSVR